MIRINLLPVKAKKSQAAGRQQLVGFAMVLLIAVAGNYWFYSMREDEATAAQAQVDKTKADIAQLEKVIGEVKDITTRKKDLEEKLNVLNNLKKNRSGPVKVLDAMQTAIPKKVALLTMVETNGAMALTGTAASHDDLAEFMTALENVVYTPRGIGRVVTGEGGSKTSRVELAVDGKVEEFNTSEVVPFFSNVQLTSGTESAGPTPGTKVVNFAITLVAKTAV